MLPCGIHSDSRRLIKPGIGDIAVSKTQRAITCYGNHRVLVASVIDIHKIIDGRSYLITHLYRNFSRRRPCGYFYR